MQKITTYLIPLFVCGFFFWLGWGNYSKLRESNSWPTASGKMVRSEVIETGRMAKAMYTARVSYEYEVGGQRYKGEQVGFMDGSSSHRSDAEAIIQSRPVGAEVEVFYNPRNPHEACLERSIGMIPWLMMIGGVLGIFGVGKMALNGGRIKTTTRRSSF